MSVGTTAPAAAQGDLGGYIERAPMPIYVWERHHGELRLAAMNQLARDARPYAGETREPVQRLGQRALCDLDRGLHRGPDPSG